MEENESTPKYHVYDRKTGERANNTEYKNKSRARRAVDRLDNEYGAYRYYVQQAETPTKGMGSSVGGGGGMRSGGGGTGGGGMNPVDVEKVPGKRQLKMAKGGFVRAADGIAKRGKTKGRMV